MVKEMAKACLLGTMVNDTKEGSKMTSEMDMALISTLIKILIKVDSPMA
jgi:hypothetical protein